jgi:uncharacterized membrane protein YfcA
VRGRYDAAAVELDPWPFALACLASFAASILGGLAGYGTGLVLPVFLAPVVGVADLIPVMAVAMLFNNGSRVVAFRRDMRWDHFRAVMLLGMPACLLGAFGYTLLTGRWIAALIGSFLLLSVPLRRYLTKHRWQLGAGGERGAGAVFGFVNGGMTGAGVLLISLLMAAGLSGAALIATDAIVSLIMGLAKVALFGSLARLDLRLGAVGVTVGLCAVPGAFVARALLSRMSAPLHAAIMEVVVVFGAFGFLWRALAP